MSFWWVQAVVHFQDAMIETITMRLSMRWHGSDEAQAEALRVALIGTTRAWPYTDGDWDKVAVARVLAFCPDEGAW